MACGNPFLYLKISALSGHVRRIAYWCPHRPTNKTGFLLIFMKNIYPEYPCFPQDFISSFPCRKMGLEVFGFYNWFLMHSWVYSEKPCHLPTDISDLKIVFNVDEQLINNCITILFDLGKILKTEDKKYYYNPRLLCEYKKLQKRSKIYSENRKCRDRKGMKNKVKQQLLNNSSTILLQADNDNDSDNDNKDIKEDIKNSAVERCYKLYPIKDVNYENRSTGKTVKDKDKIRKIIKTHYPLYKAMKYYLYNCDNNRTYLKNLSVFLNNLPATDLLDDFSIADIKSKEEEYI